MYQNSQKRKTGFLVCLAFLVSLVLGSCSHAYQNPDGIQVTRTKVVGAYSDGDFIGVGIIITERISIPPNCRFIAMVGSQQMAEFLSNMTQLEGMCFLEETLNRSNNVYKIMD